MRNKIIEKLCIPVEIGDAAKKLIDDYKYNTRLVFDEECLKYPLYALLTIMAHAKKCALVIARKNITEFSWGNSARENYIVYQAYMREYQTAYNELVKHLNDPALNNELEEVKNKLVESTAIKYDDNVSLMIDIFDTDSVLYGIEGISYAR